VPASVPVIAFLVTSRILDHSGQVLTLAYGLAAASPPLVLLFAAFPIASWGTTAGNSLLWWIGFISLVAGGLVSVLTRFIDHSGDKIRDVGIEFDDRTS
jgi:hypothetical protein